MCLAKRQLLKCIPAFWLYFLFLESLSVPTCLLLGNCSLYHLMFKYVLFFSLDFTHEQG